VKRMQKRWLWVALLIVGLGLGASAQTAVTALSVVPGVAEFGAGGAGIAVVNGAETLYYNPAGLALLPGISFSSFYSSHLGLGDYSALALAFRNFAVGAILLSSGDIQGYDGSGNPTETLSFSNTAFLFGFGLSPSDIPFLSSIPFNFTFGGTLKGITASYGGTSGAGFTVDLAFRMALPNMGFGPITITDTAFGITAVNLFGSLSHDGEKDNFPMDIRLGASTKIAQVVQVAADLHLGGGAFFGITYSPVPTLSLRLGLMSVGGLSITAGIGLNVQGFQIDYAYASHTLGGSHRVGLTIDFSALDIGAISRSLRRILP
jgi:hypothetical protein